MSNQLSTLEKGDVASPIVRPMPRGQLRYDNIETHRLATLAVSDPVLLFAAYAETCAELSREQPAVRGDDRNPRIVDLHAKRDEIRQPMMQSPDVLRVLDFLLCYRTAIYMSLTFPHGTEQPLHRDTPVFRTGPEEFYFGVWFALEAATADYGALRTLAGRHQVGPIDQYEFADRNLPDESELGEDGNPLWNTYQEDMVAACRYEDAEEVLMEANKGDVVIWRRQLPHGGSPIKDGSQTRHSEVFHVTPENERVYQARAFFLRETETPANPQYHFERFEGRDFVIPQTVSGTN